MIIVLDSGPAGLIVHAKGSEQSRKCGEWLETMLLAGHSVVVPEIVDYKLRRELLRLRKSVSLRRLDWMAETLLYLPITTAAMRRAAEYWAIARQRGQPTAGDRTIDSDMILVAQTELVNAARREETVIATTNVRHLNRFTQAQLWEHIQ
jgi:predicted nucleic acid-binding protein